MTPQTQEPKKQLSTSKRVLITIATVLAGLFSFTSILALVAAICTWSSTQVGMSVFSIAFALAIAVVMVWLTIYLYSLIKTPEPVVYVCQCCGKGAPTMKARLNRHIGAILLNARSLP